MGVGKVERPHVLPSGCMWGYSFCNAKDFQLMGETGSDLTGCGYLVSGAILTLRDAGYSPAAGMSVETAEH